MFWHWNFDFVELWLRHSIQDSWFVPQITLTDFAESYIRKESNIERFLISYYPHYIAGVLKYLRSQIGAMSEARSYCDCSRNCAKTFHTVLAFFRLGLTWMHICRTEVQNSAYLEIFWQSQLWQLCLFALKRGWFKLTGVSKVVL